MLADAAHLIALQAASPAAAAAAAPDGSGKLSVLYLLKAQSCFLSSSQ